MQIRKGKDDIFIRAKDNCLYHRNINWGKKIPLKKTTSVFPPSMFALKTKKMYRFNLLLRYYLLLISKFAVGGAALLRGSFFALQLASPGLNLSSPDFL